MRRLVFDQSSAVQPVSEPRGGPLSLTEDRGGRRRTEQEILVSNIGYYLNYIKWYCESLYVYSLLCIWPHNKIYSYIHVMFNIYCQSLCEYWFYSMLDTIKHFLYICCKASCKYSIYTASCWLQMYICIK